jgi:hypothetical protein
MTACGALLTADDAPRKLAVLKKAEGVICRIFLFSQEKGAAAIYSQGAPVT